MKVEDAIILALDFCHEDGVASLLRQEDSTLTDEEQDKVDAMTRCFNLVYEEISSQYLPVIITETKKSSDGKVLYSDLSQKVLDVIEVKNGHGKKIKFRKFDSYIFALANEMIISYKTLPPILTQSSEFYSTLPERVFAYGMAREFFYLQGAGDEAEVYDNRFKDSLLVLLGKSKEIVMPVRGWR